MKLWFSLFMMMGMVLLHGCGYTVRMVALEEEQRELQEKKSLEGDVARLQVDLKKLRKQNRQAAIILKEEISRNGTLFKAGLKDSRKEILGLQKGQTDLNVRMDEATFQFRGVQGHFEEQDRLFSALSHQVENVAFRVNKHGESKEKLTKQVRKLESLLQSQMRIVDALKESLRRQLDAISLVDRNLRKVSKEQEKSLQVVSDQASELAEKIPPVLNRQSVRLDELEWQVKKMSSEVDVKQIDKDLATFSRALDTLKKTLELLGGRMTTKLDEQGRLIRDTTKKVRGIEARLTQGDRPASLSSKAK
ncbi:MAG: hypothetical protein ABGX83_00105 [Nitrospira sp.]|nr:hypothetical protein [Candidatus Manganitrophaceae bacterium]HIL34925.1 hypothetical protein [Candidatus Manganitrophaceae bacterium]